MRRELSSVSLKEMTGRWAQRAAARVADAKILIDRLERPEKTRKRVRQGFRSLSSLMKIAIAKLIGLRNDGDSHWAIFMGSLRPCKSLPGIDPDCEAHRAIEPLSRA